MSSELIKTINAFAKESLATASNTERHELLKAAQTLVETLESPIDTLAKLALNV
jgi:hypothetical protein